MLLVSLPRSERVPPLIFRLTTQTTLRRVVVRRRLGLGDEGEQLRQEAFQLAQHPHGRIAAQVRLTDGPSHCW